MHTSAGPRTARKVKTLTRPSATLSAKAGEGASTVFPERRIRVALIASAVSSARNAQLGTRDAVHWQDHHEFTPHRIGTFEYQPPSMCLGDPSGDGEAEACAAGGAGMTGAVAAEEAV